MTNEEERLIVVTGATGYVGAHVVQQLLQAGYRVRGTVRQLPDREILEQESSLQEQLQNPKLTKVERSNLMSKQEKISREKKKRDKVQFLYDLCPDVKHKLELTQADLLDADCWDKVLEQATHVIHVASPFPYGTGVSEKDVIPPAKDGTLNVLRACSKLTTLKRVVLTSSVIAIVGAGSAGCFDEKSWACLETSTVYAKSKILAEREAWNFLKSMPDENSFELAVINPSFILGPVLNKTVGTSTKVMTQLLKGGISIVPNLQMSVADVRDVAKCHINALTAPGAAGFRHIVAADGPSMWMMDVAKLLAEEFTPLGYRIPTRKCPRFLLWIGSWLSKDVAELYRRDGVEFSCDNTRMRQVLGVQPRSVRSTLLDMAYSLIEKGFVPKTTRYRDQSQDGSASSK